VFINTQAGAEILWTRPPATLPWRQWKVVHGEREIMVKGKCKKKRRATCVMRAKFCFTNLHGGSTDMHGEESALIEEVEYR
jgi:hypothetical protein